MTLRFVQWLSPMESGLLAHGGALGPQNLSLILYPANQWEEEWKKEME